MRKIRNAAVAGLAAVSLVAGTMSAATADEDTNQTAAGSSQSSEMSKMDEDAKDKDKNTQENFSAAVEGINSSESGKRYHADKEVAGRNLLGLDFDLDKTPAWAQIWLAVTVLGVIGSAIGLVGLPALNHAKAQGVIV